MFNRQMMKVVSSNLTLSNKANKHVSQNVEPLFQGILNVFQAMDLLANRETVQGPPATLNILAYSLVCAYP